MFKITSRKLIFLAGSIWLCVGIFLLSLGLHFLTETYPGEKEMLLLVLALVIGFIKGKTVLTKAAKKQVRRLSALESPKLHQLYSPAYYLLLLVMFGFGFLLKVLPISLSTRGTIDIAIGFALIHGALHYFRKCPPNEK